MTIVWRWLTRITLLNLVSFAGLAQIQQLYIGTYTNTAAHSPGIYSVTFDTKTGRLDNLKPAAETKNPSYLARHPSRPFLYAVNESTEGTVSSFAIDANGGLTFLGSSSTKGSPCYVTVDGSGKWLLVANYGGGSIAVLPIRPDGTAGDAIVTQHSGSGPTPNQKGPHPHQMVEMANGIILVPDLGADRVARYRFNAASGELSAAKPAEIRLPPGSGPRHLVPSADGKFLYVLSELASSVTVFAESRSGESWDVIQTESLLPPGFDRPNTGAEIMLHPNGRFLYASNRGADTIALLSIDGATKKVTRMDAAPTGANPRFFTVDQSGKWLLAAGQTSGTITVFAIDSRTGRLKSQPDPLSVPAPVFIGASVSH